jgi:hypothetical protein
MRFELEEELSAGVDEVPGGGESSTKKVMSLELEEKL